MGFFEMAMVSMASAFFGFALGVIICDIRDIKDLKEMEEIFKEGRNRLSKEISDKKAENIRLNEINKALKKMLEEQGEINA